MVQYGSLHAVLRLEAIAKVCICYGLWRAWIIFAVVESFFARVFVKMG